MYISSFVLTPFTVSVTVTITVTNYYIRMVASAAYILNKPPVVFFTVWDQYPEFPKQHELRQTTAHYVGSVAAQTVCSNKEGKTIDSIKKSFSYITWNMFIFSSHIALFSIITIFSSKGLVTCYARISTNYRKNHVYLW